MAEADAVLVAELRAMLDSDELVKVLGLARPDLDPLEADQDGTRQEGAHP